VSLQKAIGEKFGVKSRISLGSPGGFIVVVNGLSVFDYKKEGSLPPMNDLLQRIAVSGRAG